MAKIFSYKLWHFEEAFNPHLQALETHPPTRQELCISGSDFNDPLATYFHTSSDSDKVCLKIDKKILSLILDSSGSQTWNSANNERITFFRKLLQTLNATFPEDSVYVNLIEFLGLPRTSTSRRLAKLMLHLLWTTSKRRFFKTVSMTSLPCVSFAR